jgi:hypothetical protein
MSAEIIPFPEPVDQQTELEKALWRQMRTIFGLPPDAGPSPAMAVAGARIAASILRAIPDYDIRKSYLPLKD